MIFRDSYYDETSGLSVSIVQHLGKTFIGEARLHPDDKNKASKFAGCRLAELRAEAKALKYEYNQAKIDSEACRKVMIACTQTKAFDKESNTAKVLFHQVNIKIKKVNRIADLYNDKLEEIQAYIRRRDVVTKAIEAKAKNS